MYKRNYNVYDDFGVRKTELIRNIAVLDTGAGRNFINSAQVPEEVVTRKIVIDLKISDGIGNLFK